MRLRDRCSKGALFILFAAEALLPVKTASAAEGKCPDRPELIAPANPTKEEQKHVRERLRELRAAGTVAITIDEKGNVVETNVVRASSKEAGIELSKQAQAMKFRPRPGCGVFRTQVNFGPL